VQAFDPRGKPLRSIGRPGSADGEIKNEVAGIAINSLGQIILADPGGYRLQIFTLQGKFVRAFGARGTENGRFIRPQGVCVDGENRIYTVDNGADNVQVFSPDGAFLFRFGKTGNGKGEFNEPECIAVHKDRIYVADEGNGRIQYFDLKGNYQGELGRKVIPFPSGARPDGYQEAPKDYLSSYFRGDVEGIAFDNEGTLYASDEDEGTVELLAESGTRLGSFTSSEKGGMKKVQGLAMNSQRTKLYVCDEGNMRIQVFDIPSIKRAVLRKP
jgi:DNA-binding beta-propeller fold protein YncE